MIKVHYFGIIAEAARQEADVMALEGEDLKTLVTRLTAKHHLDSYRFQVALNRKIVKDLDAVSLRDGDEVALLPAFSGG